MPIAGEVAIIGVGTTQFGVLHDRSYLSLLAEASNTAVADAGLSLKDVQAAWLATAEPLLAGLVGDSGAALAEAIGFAPRPVTRVSNFCTSGMEAVRGAAMAIAAGEFEVCLAVGAEKMRDVAPRDSLLAKTANQTHPTLSKGRTAPGQFALVANRYLSTYGYEPSLLAQVAVKNHEHAMRNPKAHYRKPVTVEQVMAAARVAEPLGVLDSTPTTDGAAAVIVASREWAEKHARRYAIIQGVGLAVTDGYYSVHYRETSDFLGFASTRHAAETAYKQAGITDPRSQLDLVECHDCFTITEIVNTEDLGLVGRGEGGKLLMSGATAAGGDIPVNISGGLQSCGHPVGATGVRMITEIVNQVTGESGERQIAGARRGLAHTLGGPGVISCVMVLGAPGS
jgi:acetyl-CoA C-acetyltransferase